MRFDPEDAFAYCVRGWVREQMGDHKGALADLTRDVQMCPNEGNPLLERGRLLIKMGDSVQARSDLHRAIELFTKKADDEGVRLAREALPAPPTAPPPQPAPGRTSEPVPETPKPKPTPRKVHRFYGTVTIDGSPALDGAGVSAWHCLH